MCDTKISKTERNMEKPKFNLRRVRTMPLQIKEIRRSGSQCIELSSKQVIQTDSVTFSDLQNQNECQLKKKPAPVEIPRVPQIPS